MKYNKTEVLYKAKEILGFQFVKGINISDGTLYKHIRIFYDSIIFKNDLRKLDDYFNKQWSNITHTSKYNEILYLIEK